MRELAYIEELIQVLEYESLASRIAVEIDSPGPVVDYVQLPENECRARRMAHQRENERLLAVLEDAAETFAVECLNAVSLFEAACNFADARIVMRRRCARVLTGRLPMEQQVIEPALVRVGYFGVLGPNVMVVGPIADYLTVDVFPAHTAFIVPRGAVELWRSARKNAIRFSIEAAKTVRKVVEQ